MIRTTHISKSLLARMASDCEGLLSGSNVVRQDDTPLAVLKLSARVRKACGRLGISTVGQLIATPEEELLRLPSFGQTSIREVRRITREFLEITIATGPKGTAAVSRQEPHVPLRVQEDAGMGGTVKRGARW